ncbi:WD-repeat protein GhTTG1 [Capsaspora owczarzaki ATCC 30864]|uniref:WD-repeat protein GhTTG1 n=1 Tax=Capsaspora owczarzaki (strain ATCC 30864) TaxID=595528 RepID=A0A0D2UCI7_CAPO3|nr:WD-repeat protein GhTTG1 [Capsaspora owczarzaki ATCC 30864]KJE92746.1 WD-repeat protein GhTTG1 [Capsaspora owczarzaki ATCC 30864]|eukprot:XP_004363383.1 WD-repeat protein GhTTG1 [Capsaspora owczarzaki ATCC 30864]
MSTVESRRKEVYTYKAPWSVYTLNWSNRQRYRLAVGSFLEEYSNQVTIVQLDDDKNDFVCNATFDHSYPATKLMWAPENANCDQDMLATTGDYLRLWRVDDQNKAKLVGILNNNRQSEYCAPLTSFDWNDVDPNIIGTASIDTTCTIWDVQAQAVRTQLIAHDKEVYDIAFAHSKDIFASVGADGSVRMFDLRNLEHSTIMYETAELTPLLRIEWNKKNPNYLATFMMDSSEVIIIDTRFPSVPYAELTAHRGSVNGISWAPHSSCHICTVGDDAQALIWDISQSMRPIEDPILAYFSGAEVDQVQWSTTQPDWIGIGLGNRVQILRV